MLIFAVVRCLHNINCVYRAIEKSCVPYGFGPVTQFIVCYVIIGMLNPNSYVTMDQMYRFFDIRKESDEDKGEYNVLTMTSGLDGEYGPISLVVSAELDSKYPDLHCNFIQTSAASPGVLHVFRCAEVSYFVNKILPLFNPVTRFQNEVPLSPSPQPSNP